MQKGKNSIIDKREVESISKLQSRSCLLLSLLYMKKGYKWRDSDPTMLEDNADIFVFLDNS